MAVANVHFTVSGNGAGSGVNAVLWGLRRAWAQAWGPVNRVVLDSQVPAATRELLARATRGSAASKALGKQAFYRQVELDTAGAYAHASEVMAAASQTPHAQEGLRAFLEKRKPRFD